MDNIFELEKKFIKHYKKVILDYFRKLTKWGLRLEGRVA